MRFPNNRGIGKREKIRGDIYVAMVIIVVPKWTPLWRIFGEKRGSWADIFTEGKKE